MKYEINELTLWCTAAFEKKTGTTRMLYWKQQGRNYNKIRFLGAHSVFEYLPPLLLLHALLKLVFRKHFQTKENIPRGRSI